MRYSEKVLQCKKKLVIRRAKQFRLCMQKFNEYEIDTQNTLFPQLDPLIEEFLESEDSHYNATPKFIRPDPDDEEFHEYHPFTAKEHFKRAIKYGRVLPVSNHTLAFHKKYDFLSYKICIIWNKHFPKDILKNMDVVCKLLRGMPVHKSLKKRFMHTLTAARLETAVEILRTKLLKKLDLY